MIEEAEAEELPLPSFAELFGEAPLLKKRRRGGGPRDEQEISGRWTPEEHRAFLEGVMLHGKDWKKMQPLIKTRSLVQIRTHAQKVFKKVGMKKLQAGRLPDGLITDEEGVEGGVEQPTGSENNDEPVGDRFELYEEEEEEA